MLVKNIEEQMTDPTNEQAVSFKLCYHIYTFSILINSPFLGGRCLEKGMWLTLPQQHGHEYKLQKLRRCLSSTNHRCDHCQLRWPNGNLHCTEGLSLKCVSGWIKVAFSKKSYRQLIKHSDWTFCWVKVMNGFVGAQYLLFTIGRASLCNILACLLIFFA